MTIDQFEAVIAFLEKQIEANTGNQAYLDAYLKVIELEYLHREKRAEVRLKESTSNDQVEIERIKSEASQSTCHKR